MQMQSLRRPLEPLRQIRVLRLIICCRRLILHKREKIACVRQDWYLYVMHLISKVPWHMEIVLNSLFTWYLLIIFVTLQKTKDSTKSKLLWKFTSFQIDSTVGSQLIWKSTTSLLLTVLLSSFSDYQKSLCACTINTWCSNNPLF